MKTMNKLLFDLQEFTISFAMALWVLRDILISFFIIALVLFIIAVWVFDKYMTTRENGDG